MERALLENALLEELGKIGINFGDRRYKEDFLFHAQVADTFYNKKKESKMVPEERLLYRVFNESGEQIARDLKGLKEFLFENRLNRITDLG